MLNRSRWRVLAGFAVCSLSVALCGGGARAQSAPPAQPSPAPSAAPAPPSSLPVPAPPAGVIPAAPASVSAPPPLPRQADLALLGRALAPLLGSHSAESVSAMQITAIKGKSVFTLREQLKATAKRPGHFVSEVVMQSSPRARATRYQVVSDGLKVTTYRAGLKKYSVVPLAAFQAGDNDFPSLGLVVGLLYLGDKSFVTGLSRIAKDGTGQSQAALHKTGMSLTTKDVVLRGIGYTTFALTVGKVGTYRFYIDPATERLAVLEMRTRQDGVTIHMVERITSFTPLGQVPPGVFHFTPPAGTTKVPALAVSFF